MLDDRWVSIIGSVRKHLWFALPFGRLNHCGLFHRAGGGHLSFWMVWGAGVTVRPQEDFYPARSPLDITLHETDTFTVHSFNSPKKASDISGGGEGIRAIFPVE